MLKSETTFLYDDWESKKYHKLFYNLFFDDIFE